MGIFYLLGIFICISIFLIIWDFHIYDGWQGFIGGLILVPSIVVLIFAFIAMMTLESDFAYIEAQYNNLKEQIEYCENDDIVTENNLRGQVLDMNNTIAKHREYSKNYWIGIYYSKRIGNFENLKWKSERYDNR